MNNETERDAYVLAEAIFYRAFAYNPEQEINPLIARCLEAALLFDEGIARLKTGAASPAIAALKSTMPTATGPAKANPQFAKPPRKEKRSGSR
jgi:hypothetical protein